MREKTLFENLSRSLSSPALISNSRLSLIHSPSFSPLFLPLCPSALSALSLVGTKADLPRKMSRLPRVKAFKVGTLR